MGGDPDRCAPPAGAENLGGFLQRGIHGLKSAGRQEEDKGKGVQDRDQDHAPHREDVERQERKPHNIAEKPVDEAGIGAEEVDEGDRGQKGRCDVGDVGCHPDESLGRQVGAADGPCNRKTDDDAQQACPCAQDEGVEQGLVEEPLAEGTAEVGKRESSLDGNAAPQERSEGKDDENDQG